MNIKELIDKLQTYPPETMVVVSGYEGGVHEVNHPELIKIKTNVNTAWYYGEHEQDEKGDTPALHIY